MLPEPAPGFDDPLALLRACHARILKQCTTLDALVARLRTHGVDAEVRQAASDVYRYFTTAGRHHHEDEELDLFPLLRADPSLAALCAALQLDHDRMGQLWQQLEPWLAAPESIPSHDDVAARIAEFNALQRQHVERENRELLPRAESLLAPVLRAVIGERMARRRGISR